VDKQEFSLKINSKGARKNISSFRGWRKKNFLVCFGGRKTNFSGRKKWLHFSEFVGLYDQASVHDQFGDV